MKTLPMIVALLLISSACFGATLTRDQLLDLANKGVAEDVLASLVGRDCVDFDVDAANVAELTQRLPPKVLSAVIECRKKPAALPSESALRAAEPLTLKQVQAVAVAALEIDGVADTGTASYLAEQVRERRPSWTVIGPTQLRVEVEKAGVTSDAPLSAYLDAARRLRGPGNHSRGRYRCDGHGWSSQRDDRPAASGGEYRQSPVERRW